jgi:hypothetical protein
MNSGLRFLSEVGLVSVYGPLSAKMANLPPEQIHTLAAGHNQAREVKHARVSDKIGRVNALPAHDPLGGRLWL